MKSCFWRILLIIAASFFWTGCGGDHDASVSSVAESWLEVKSAYHKPDSLQYLSGQIDDFRQTLKAFYASPVGSLYFIHHSDEMNSISHIDSVLDQLNIAVQTNNEEMVFAAMLEIDRSLNLLRRIDTRLSDTSQMHYFQLFFFFSVLVIAIILGLRIMYNRAEKAETRERESLTFSREAVMAQEQERERIARELHDTALQDLWRLSFQTDSIGKAADSEERERLYKEVSSGQRELMRRIRNICDNLIPPDFHVRRLDEILQSLCYNFEQRSNIKCQFIIQDTLQPGALDSSKQLHCFRIVQECLTNIEKHSSASEASVLVRSESSGTLLICISDNGKGLSPDLFPGLSALLDRDFSRKLRTQGHFGLWNMHERAASIGGTISIDSEVGEGAMITLCIPLEKNA